MKLVDLHCDVLSSIFDGKQSLLENEGQFDIKRAQAADVTVQFMAIFNHPFHIGSNLDKVFKQIEYFQEEINTNPDEVYNLLSFNDYIKNRDNKRIGCLLHLEGAECLGTDMENLYRLFAAGVRSMGLTWNYRNQLADGVAEETPIGLTKLGRSMLQEMEKLNMIIDLAHIERKSFFEALEICSKPVLVSHANVKKLCPHKRNLDDEQLLALAEIGGLIGISQVADFIHEDRKGINEMLDHFVYVADLIGVEHLALGSDFDGAEDVILHDISEYKKLPDYLSQRGFTNAEIEKILKDNALAFLQKTLN